MEMRPENPGFPAEISAVARTAAMRADRVQPFDSISPWILEFPDSPECLDLISRVTQPAVP